MDKTRTFYCQVDLNLKGQKYVALERLSVNVQYELTDSIYINLDKTECNTL